MLVPFVHNLHGDVGSMGGVRGPVNSSFISPMVRCTFQFFRARLPRNKIHCDLLVCFSALILYRVVCILLFSVENILPWYNLH